MDKISANSKLAAIQSYYKLNNFNKTIEYSMFDNHIDTDIAINNDFDVEFIDFNVI